jgi:hypothetical protein
MSITQERVQGTITDLTNEDTGAYVVTTSSKSRYVIDLDERTVSRHRDDESDWYGDVQRNNFSHGLINIASCEVGKGMVIVIDQIVPGEKDKVGAKFTTAVVDIQPA